MRLSWRPPILELLRLVSRESWVSLKRLLFLVYDMDCATVERTQQGQRVGGGAQRK